MNPLPFEDPAVGRMTMFLTQNNEDEPVSAVRTGTGENKIKSDQRYTKMEPNGKTSDGLADL